MQSKFFPKRVFTLSGNYLTVYQWDGARMMEPVTFGFEHDGLTQFAVYLEQSPKTPAYLLADIVEEEFREESIPHVFGPDRRALLRAKMNRLFRDSKFSNAVFISRDKDGRRDDRYLFSSIINPDTLSPWLAQIYRYKVPLAGIYSLPIVSEQLLKRISITSDNALLVTLHRTGGLRQSFFQDKKLRISRLATMPSLDESRIASYVLGEVEKIRRYLNSLRLLSRDSPLDIYIVSHGQPLTDLHAQVEDTLTTRHHFLDVADVARKVGIRGKLLSWYADAIFAQLLANLSPPAFYGSGGETRYFEMHRLRMGLAATSIVLLLASIGWSGFEFIDGIVAERETATFLQQADFYRVRYDRAKARLPRVPAKGKELRTAVQMASTLRKYRSSPYAMMVVLSQGFNRAPNLKLDNLNWIATGDLDAKVENPMPQSGGSRDRNARDGFKPTGDFYQIARIEGHVQEFAGNYRQAMEQVDRLADFLAQVDGVEQVKKVQMPLDLGSDKAITGTAGVKRRSTKAQFKLDVVLKTRDGQS